MPRADHRDVNELAPGSHPDQPRLDLSSLTDREREIVAVAMSGLPVAAIAETIALSEATVRSHLAHIYTKLDVTGRIELLARVNGSLASAEPVEPTPEALPPIHQRRRRRSTMITVAGVALAFVAMAVLRPDLPPSTDLAAVSRLVSERQVASLDLRGDRLFVTTIDGKRYRVDGAERSAVEALQAVAVAQGVGVSAGGDTDANLLLMAGSSILPLGLVALGLAAIWLVCSRRGPTPAAAP